VLDASVRRSLPNTIELTIQERDPAAIVRFEGGSGHRRVGQALASADQFASSFPS
jgi:hypothetical protein